MKPPFDLIIADSDMGTTITAITRGGAKFLRSLDPDYRRPDSWIILDTPDIFIPHLPLDLKVGMVNPKTKIISLLTRKHLH